MNALRTLPTLFLLAAVLIAPNGANAQARNASRVDFDDQLVQGQVNRGAVHLIERKDSDLGSLVKVRKNYRKEILAGTAVEEAGEPAKADIVAPKGLPVVKPAETSEAPNAEAKVAPAKSAAAVKAPAAKTAKAAKAAKTPSKKVTSKSKPNSKSSGGNRVVSRR